MTNDPEIVVLHGGTSDEREVSLDSGHCVFEALKEDYNVRLFDLKGDALPRELMDLERVIAFPVLHGAFGEDGQLQALLEQANVEYVGSDSFSSALCMDKIRTKEKVAQLGFLTAEDVIFDADVKPDADTVIDKLGENLILKIYNKGSTNGVYWIAGCEALKDQLSKIQGGKWLIEAFIVGRELTVAMLNGKSMGIVEICPPEGRYDYRSKYTPGTTAYFFPARVDREVEDYVKHSAEEIFKVCGCRDYARADYILSESGEVYFLEINTIPGFTPTSLLPKSASCMGYDFKALVSALVEFALTRFKLLYPVAVINVV